MSNRIEGLNVHQEKFMDTFRRLTYRHQRWEVWSDFVSMTAIAIVNAVDKAHFETREARYMAIINRYESQEQKLFQKLFHIVVAALEAEPEQDFLGDLFMKLELSNHWKGQFFTTYQISRLIAEIQSVDLEQLIEQRGHISINDPACGAGALLIAFANSCRAKGINYQQHVLFVAQDIDNTAAMMCYIQLSLLGCPGYIVVANTLAHPDTGDLTSDNVWLTPFYFSKVWHWRRVFQSIDTLINQSTPKKAAVVQELMAPQKEEEPIYITEQLTLF
ncbi:N-6 DNA methylase [Paenibacillus albidus]|uniref:N-6 DNA methylase n=1 Tax=Paenibacillus albidus TaxID=2041023 RepID=UPI001BEB3C6A|nr:N-6 DNA methylase [Paenibacillus albidus]MBT2293116.1 N-6 DNA methylase [Paenibacillus albidus]